MTHFRLDVSRETGAVTLWMAAKETPCGFRPVIGWPSMDGAKEFAEMLLDFCNGRKGETHKVRKVSDYLLGQVLGDEECF